MKWFNRGTPKSIPSADRSLDDSSLDDPSLADSLAELRAEPLAPAPTIPSEAQLDVSSIDPVEPPPSPHNGGAVGEACAKHVTLKVPQNGGFRGRNAYNGDSSNLRQLELAVQPEPSAQPEPEVQPRLTLKTWLQRHPWIFTPLLGIFPAIAWSLEHNRPTPPTPPVEIFSRPVGAAGSLSGSSPTGLRSPAPLPGKLPAVNATASPGASPGASPSLVPVDLSKLTPEQKAMNARAKAAFEATSAPVDAYVEMHISLGRGAAIVVASSTPATVLDDKGNKLDSLTAGEVYTAQIGSQGIVLSSQPLPTAVFIQPDPGGLLYIGNRAYRGKVLLVIDRGQLLAVNYVNLRHYLYSVVASEVSPSWKPEALKAQAVAARSYALTYYFRPANPLYHMGNDEYFQVYSGIEKEDDRTNQAVDMTSGEYVSYKGGIVESLYAASDDIVAEAFAGKGMSQLGALSLAEQGYQYSQILGNYYPGTKVGRIVQDY